MILSILNDVKLITIESKTLFCFSISACLFTFSSVLGEVLESGNIKKSIKRILTWIIQPILFIFSSFALIGLPFLLKNLDFHRHTNSFTLTSMALIFLSIMIKETKSRSEEIEKIFNLAEKLNVFENINKDKRKDDKNSSSDVSKN